MLAIAALLALASACMPPRESNETTGEQAAGEPMESCSAEGAAPAAAPAEPEAPQALPHRVRPDLKAALPRDPVGAVAKAQAAKAAAEPEPVVPDGPAPKIAATEAAFDYGKVGQGSVVKHTFTVRNEGEGPLKIERADGG